MDQVGRRGHGPGVSVFGSPGGEGWSSIFSLTFVPLSFGYTRKELRVHTFARSLSVLGLTQREVNLFHKLPW